MRKGQKMPEELRLKRIEYMKAHPLKYWQGKSRKYYTLSAEGRQRIIEGLKNRRVSENVLKHVANLNKGKTGKDHPCWKDEKKRPLYGSIRELYEYRKWRDSIFERDNYICILCGKRGGDIQADHFPKMFIDIITENKIDTIERAQGCDALWNLQNGRTLCIKCHRGTFNWGRNFHAKRLSEKKLQ